jgi:uncharacterized repeat protein (TIGR02543 family)
MQLFRLFARAITTFVALMVTATALSLTSFTAPASAAGGTVTQGAPTSGATTVDGSSAFSDQLSGTGDGSTVTYATLVSSAGISVNPAGLVTTAGVLAVGTYAVSGTDIDQGADTGNWSYSLSVTASTVTQAAPTAATVTEAESAGFSDQLNVTGNHGAVTYLTSPGGSGGVAVASNGAVTTAGRLSAGTYTLSGTDSDVDGDAGVWTYTLTVASPPPPHSGGVLVQTSATSGFTTTSKSATFVPPAITVRDNNGTVAFVTTNSDPDLEVSPGGVVSVTASLVPGSYAASGTDRDASGDTGTWSYTLTVGDPTETVKFRANGGTGAMAAQTEDRATPLSNNEFRRAGYTFASWSTSANGLGVSYANGATYSFVSSVTLYAHWRKKATAFHTVTFFAHGGTGSMASERADRAKRLSKVAFTRKGYSFKNWSTKASGNGKSFPNRATYSFRGALLLYAQWKKDKQAPAKPESTVTYVANGGSGVMAKEFGQVPTALSQVTFTRTGFTFVSWNTRVGGSGKNYLNRAEFPFKASVTLYAQWKMKKEKTVVAPPIVYGGLILGPFASGSSLLTLGLENQIRDIARDVKSHHQTEISLLGFGDNLSGTAARSATNVALGRRRAQAVASYLQSRLSTLRLKGGWSISIGGAGTGKTSTGQTESSMVSVTLS